MSAVSSARRIFLPLVAFGLIAYAVYFSMLPKAAQNEGPVIPPTTSPFEHRVGGIGVTEPASENIAIGAEIPGVAKTIHVKVGDQVKAGDALFSLDDREARAQLDLAQAQRDAAKIQAEDARQQLSIYEAVSDKRAISTDELSRRRFAAKLADSRIKEAEAQLRVAATALERMTVRAPIDGKILRVNLRPGEFAQTGALREPLMIMGDTSTMHVRIEVDETDARRIDPKAEAVASLRGYKGEAAKLTFVRREPLVLPKRLLTGDGNERVDTRVQQLIYSFDNSTLGASVGQQMDAYIEAGPVGEARP